MKFRYYIVDVFTSQRFGGNQLAVFPDAANIPEELLISVTREFNFSETTFVYQPKNPVNTKRVRIFTPAGELPFAGHPTIGTAFVLGTIGEILLSNPETKIIFEEGVGNVPVTIRSINGKPFFSELTAAKLPEFSEVAITAEAIADFLSLSRDDISDEFPIQSVSCGVPFLFVPVNDRETLKRIRVNVEKMSQVLSNVPNKEVFVFTNDPEQKGFHFRARMFAPLLGIPEDPATGSAAAAFSGYLAKIDPQHHGILQWNIEQGFEMGRPSLLFIEADKNNGSITAVRVGGSSVMVCEGELEI